MLQWTYWGGRCLSTVNILHLSDLHFGAGGKDPNVLAQRENAFNGFLNAVAQQEWNPDILVISGDIAYKGKNADYLQAMTWLNEICFKLDIPPERIILVPGNHDVDRDETIGMEPPPNAKKADNWLSVRNLRHFKKYFADYIEFCNNMKLPKFSIGSQEYTLSGVREILDLRFIGLNSAWFCRGENDNGNLWLGLELMKVMQAEGQLKSEENYNNGPITIAVFHHPYEFLHQDERYNYFDRIPSINYIGKRAHLICCGHVHSKSVVPINKIDNAYVIIGGASYAGDNYNNSFAIIQIDQERRVARRRSFEFNPGTGKWIVNAPEDEKSLIINNENLISQFREKVNITAREYSRELQKRPYNYQVSFADSYSLLKQPGLFLEERTIDELIPGTVYPRIVLHGSGGAGKTEILKRLYPKAIEKGQLPILLDLKKYARDAEFLFGDAKDIETILTFTAPRISSWELEQLVNQTPVLMLIDAFSEVSGEVREIIISYFRKLIHKGACCVLIADRLTASWEYDGFRHAKVNYLNPHTIHAELDNTKLGSYETLDEGLKNIYKIPFFLDLAIRTNNIYINSKVRSTIFKCFFENHLKSTDVDTLAKITFEAINKDGLINYSHLETQLGKDFIRDLQSAGVLQEQSFQHHLWIDYLVSRYLSQNSQQWKDSSFDAATIYSSAAFESLMMTIEQLKSVEETDKFLKRIFDWNLTVAVQCIGELCNGGSVDPKLSSGIFAAVIATTVEKTFDGIYRTRKRAIDILQSYKQLEQWKPYLAFDIREKLATYIKLLTDDSEWFRNWKQLFVDNGEGFSDKVHLIKDEDPLIGWAAANLARRSSLSESEQAMIRTIFEQHSKAEEGSIRWRVVHCLGEYQCKENIDLLFHALTSDGYHWVQYGAMRALIEIASKSEGRMRQEILECLPKVFATITFKSEKIRHQILHEAVEATFMRNPAPGWKEEAFNFLVAIIDLVPGHSERIRLDERVQEFCDYSVTE